jgi:mannose-6-phosphate isomerase-like protein (cupin superfamily)
MRHVCITLLIVGLLAERAVAQRPADSVAFVPKGGVVAKSSGASKVSVEKRRRTADFLPAWFLSNEAEYLTKMNAIGRTLHTSGDEETTFLLVRRTTSSDPEVHARWDDLVLVRAGAGVIELGDSLVGSKYLGPGERRGGKINKSYQIEVHAGDLVRIPAAVPHSFLVSGSVPLEYLVVKQHRQNLPIRWLGER